ncbi:MAG: hypothetical protein V4628_05540 [Pseudomonadota bacterium]
MAKAQACKVDEVIDLTLSGHRKWHIGITPGFATLFVGDAIGVTTKPSMHFFWLYAGENGTVVFSLAAPDEKKAPSLVLCIHEFLTGLQTKTHQP